MITNGECDHRAPCGRQVEIIGEGDDKHGHYVIWGSHCACCGALISSWKEYEDEDLEGIHA